MALHMCPCDAQQCHTWVMPCLTSSSLRRTLWTLGMPSKPLSTLATDAKTGSVTITSWLHDRRGGS